MNMIDKIKQLFVILFQFPIKSFILVRGKKIYQIKGYTCLKTVVERNKETIPYNKREREREVEKVEDRRKKFRPGRIFTITDCTSALFVGSARAS